MTLLQITTDQVLKPAQEASLQQAMQILAQKHFGESITIKVVVQPTATIEVATLKPLHTDYEPKGVVRISGISRKNRANAFTDNSKIYLGDNFRSQILPLITDEVTTDEILRQDQLKVDKYDKDIREEVVTTDIVANTATERILQMIQNQMEGQDGITLNNGYSTIVGYVVGKNGNTFAVPCYWHSDDRQWYVLAYQLGRWSAGRRVLSAHA